MRKQYLLWLVFQNHLIIRLAGLSGKVLLTEAGLGLSAASGSLTCW